MTGNRFTGWTSAVIAALLILVPLSAAAQQNSGIAGEVTDDTGGVLPGVTIEATSPALIEGTRVVFSDGTGRYNIVGLPLGTYSVSFTLPGFSTIIREGLVLTANFTATVDAAMAVGGVEETITVTGASPLVDVQNVTAQSSVTAEMLQELPTGVKAVASSLIQLVPGVTGTADVGGTSGLYRSNGQSGGLFFHGKSDVTTLFDGMGIADPNGTSIIYMINTAYSQETVLETGGGSAESNATLTMNLIPNEGGNQFSMFTSGTYTNENMQSDNISGNYPGLSHTNRMVKFYNADFTLGGPISEDKVWFFLASKAAANKNTVPGVFFNKGFTTTLGDPNSNVHPFIADTTREGYRREWARSIGARFTIQASESQKLGIFTDFQSFYNRGRGEFASPEAFTHQYNLSPEQLYQVTYTAPVSSRLLLEAGFSHMRGQWPYPAPGDGEFATVPGAIAITELTTAFRYNARYYYADQIDKHRYAERASLSYVTGSHAFKAGFNMEHGLSTAARQVQGDVEYHFRPGIPSRLVQHATYTSDGTNGLRKERLLELGVFIQDQWTLPQFTVNYGLRFDQYVGRIPAQKLGANRFLPERSFAELNDVVNFTDINPRLGLSYDVFDDGRTALKFSIGRYVESTLSSLVGRTNPIYTSVNNVRRNWNDANGNFVPDCDLANFGSNGECGAINDNNFGKQRPGATTYQDSITQGFGNRNYVWDTSVEVQQELFPGMSMTVGYYRNWAGNWRVDDNVMVTSADYDPFCVTAPSDSRLPGGGGYEVCGMYDINPSKYGQRLTSVGSADDFIGGDSQVNCGGQRSRDRAPTAGRNCGTSNFVGISFDTRFNNGATLGGGFDTGQTSMNSCFTVDSPEQLLHCDVLIPWEAHHNLKMFFSYPLPGGVSVSGTLQSNAGKPYEAEWRAPNSVIAPSLGRNLASCGSKTVDTCTASVPVPLLKPYEQFLGRRNQLDLRFSKSFNMGGAVARANFDIYNANNAHTLLGANDRFGSKWLQPAALKNTEVDAILAGRLIHIGGSISF